MSLCAIAIHKQYSKKKIFPFNKFFFNNTHITMIYKYTRICIIILYYIKNFIWIRSLSFWLKIYIDIDYYISIHNNTHRSANQKYTIRNNSPDN